MFNIHRDNTHRIIFFGLYLSMYVSLLFGEDTLGAAKSDYLNQSNVFVLPHLGSATKKTRTDMADLAIGNIEEFFKTGKCKNKVN